MYDVLKHRCFRLGTLGRSCRDKVLHILVLSLVEGSEIGQKEKNQFAIQDHRIALANLMENSGVIMALQSGPLFGWGDQGFYTLTLISHWMLDTLRRNTNLGQIGSLQMRHFLKGLKIDMDFPRVHIFSKADLESRTPRTASPENIPWGSSYADEERKQVPWVYFTDTGPRWDNLVQVR